MNRIIIHENDLDFISIGRRDYFVKVEHPSLWGDILIPITVIVGPNAQNGEGLLAIGSVHGNEVEGPVAIKKILNRIDTNKVCGRLILIPTLNVPAFKELKRDSPLDGKNFNRVFPGDRNGTISDKMAAIVNDTIFPHAHVVLDIHSGGDTLKFVPVSSFHEMADPEQRRLTEKAARSFGCRFTMIYQNNTKGLLTSTAENYGKITIGTELGYGASVLPQGVRMAEHGILNTGILFKQIEGELIDDPEYERHEQHLVDISQEQSITLSPRTGIFEPAVNCGDPIQAGDCIGYLHDFENIDSNPIEFTAELDGYVISLAWNAKVEQGQNICSIGSVRSWETE